MDESSRIRATVMDLTWAHQIYAIPTIPSDRPFVPVPILFHDAHVRAAERSLHQAHVFDYSTYILFEHWCTARKPLRLDRIELIGMEINR